MIYCVCYPSMANAALIMTAIMIILPVLLPLVWLLAFKNRVCELNICMYFFSIVEKFEWL